MNRRRFLTALAAAVVAPKAIAEAVAHEPHPPRLADLAPVGRSDAYDVVFWSYSECAPPVRRDRLRDPRALRAAYGSSAQALPEGRQFTFPVNL